MDLYSLKKVTIITEDGVRKLLLRKIVELGASGFTCQEVQGSGSRGTRSDPFTNNVQIDVICPEPVALKILQHVADNYFDDYACIASLSDVQVVRGVRYMSPSKS